MNELELGRCDPVDYSEDLKQQMTSLVLSYRLYAEMNKRCPKIRIEPLWGWGIELCVAHYWAMSFITEWSTLTEELFKETLLRLINEPEGARYSMIVDAMAHVIYGDDIETLIWIVKIIIYINKNG